MRNRSVRLPLILAAALLLLAPPALVHAAPDDPVDAVDPTTPQATDGRDWWFGVRAGAYFDVEEMALGAELLFPMTDRFYFNPNVEFVLVDGADFITFNGDFHYDLPVEGKPLVWLGAGIAAVHFDPDGPADGDTDAGANFLAGLGYNAGTFIPYAQAKLLVTSDNNEFALMGGVRF